VLIQLSNIDYYFQIRNVDFRIYTSKRIKWLTHLVKYTYKIGFIYQLIKPTQEQLKKYNILDCAYFIVNFEIQI